MIETRVTELSVNGSRVPVDVERDRSLLGVLRDELGLTGTKYGCGEAECGACVVLIDGSPGPACRTEVGAVEGCEILTIEGLAKDGVLHPLQQAFINEGAMQCGYCIPGMIMAGVGLLAANPEPTRPEIIAAMDRHICRCGTYSRIVRAIQSAAAAMRAD
jgi:aerobic-type carbon monoxide dehydrogenase small subunit (CoxS/CutS family)